MKRLIVNADDFGLSSLINRGIINSFQEGIVTSTSIMVNGKAFPEAVELSQKYPQLDVGIHIVLVEEYPVLPPQQIPSLVTPEGRFYPNYKSFLMNFVLGRIRLMELEQELRAQIEKALASGLTLSHVNSHQHLHVFPGILTRVLNLAREYHIPWVRHSFDRSSPVNVGQYGLALLAQKARRKIIARRLRTSEYFWGVPFSGKLTKSALLKILNALPNGVSELMCHPGDPDPEYQHWHFHWKEEQNALCADVVKEFIRRNEIVLTSYRELSQ